MWKQWLIGVVLVVLAVGGAVAYRNLSAPDQAKTADERPASVVNTVLPVIETVRDQVGAVGSLKAVNAVELTTETSGRVIDVKLQSGLQVKKGDVLLQLDDRHAKADLGVIEAQLADARRQYERARSLRDKNSISQSLVDELRTAVEVSEAQRTAARVRLENHRIQAPFSGVVGLSDIDIGAYITAGTTVTTLDAVSRMELNFSIPERFIGEISPGQKVQGKSPAYPEKIFNGELVELGTRIDELSRSLPVRALIDNSEGRLRPGQFMSVNLTLRERQALVVPEQAVMLRGAEQYVFVAEDGVARRVSVTLGSRMPGQVEIMQGLTREDQVVVTGQDRLSSGDPIRVIDDENAIPDNRFALSVDS
ncbi:efflux RND transporter periplasmic adaptor subunit [Marinobacter sp. ANT_B65]|uniref:efflux RND transporter periplasmic adaptor subunit n=1 Tax=Marinobacter sp. ANT_B65 TaxID=2039467 RepID=UPI000BBF0ED2|nr:efflux RND transporter periplasmic adaptor subunit [Marinobacter sp. ANT_B65]PCM44090.1 efflux transporter periplasmic adaptor subunit [Marinobacter sp. ANT_B65]